MSLDTVVEDIRDEARARAEEVRADAEAQATEIIEDAEADAEAIRDERAEEVEATIEQEREQMLSSANLEAKQERLGARRDVLQEVRATVEDELTALDGDDREELTRALLDAASEEFDGDDVRVYGRADDEELLTDLAAEHGYEYAGERDCLGGVVVESEASRVRVNNTFDSVLEDVWEDELREISTRLFEDQ
ncbi:V-type ATP synthase subunit E [Halosimplex carlsbadense 2-9-1]|uniref:A-type ATP synthase subunit E n=1 Tax=Halosimplex carlsbadense 2-9-1 TaxID=797114 RepID=M0D061_9EURY|nr:V-type ATP synthase subunit E [Halosimplex carlsbadense]ELZ28896.1 V-type ATP synthase subunit E [Halosimplex carlsbadense 2-9-1]